MNKIVVVGVLTASLMGASAFAQSKGEADPEQSKAAAVKSATPAEKAVAKKARKEEGRNVAKSASGADDAPQNMGTAKAVSKDERQAAAATRKAAAADAVKKGQTTSGDK